MHRWRRPLLLAGAKVGKEAGQPMYEERGA